MAVVASTSANLTPSDLQERLAGSGVQQQAPAQQAQQVAPVHQRCSLSISLGEAAAPPENGPLMLLVQHYR